MKYCTLILKLSQSILKLIYKTSYKWCRKMSTQGSRLKEVRKELKLSQEEFGKKIGVSKQYVSNLEADRNFLNNEKLVSLLVDFNVSTDYILGGIGQPFIPPKYEDVKDEIMKEVEEMLKRRGL